MGKRETAGWRRSVAELERSDIPIPEMYLLRNPQSGKGKPGKHLAHS